MKVRIKTTVHMPEVPDEIEIEPGTLRDVMIKLLAGLPIGSEIIDPKTGEMRLEGLFEVYLNGLPHNGLPEGLNSEVRDGDTITLSLILLGGG